MLQKVINEEFIDDGDADQQLQDRATPIFDPWDEYAVPAFPLDVLPVTVQRFVEIQSRVIGCDASALAMASLTAFSGALSHRFALKMLRNGDWYASPRLWTLLVGDPSRKKTPIIRATTKCLEQHEQCLWDRWGEDCDERSKQEPEADEPPKPPRLVVGDTTVEALGEILARHDRGLLVRRDELAGWIGSMERYGGGKGATADRAFWLQAYDGGPFTIDRIRRGEQRIRNLSVSLLGGIQPNRLKEVRDLTSDGLLQRFVPVMVGQSTFPIDDLTAATSEEYRKLALRLFNALPAIVIMNDAALEVAAATRRKLHDLEQASSGLAAGFQAFVGKLPGVLGSFVLILHMLDEPDHGGALPVSAKHVSSASKLLDEFVLPHAFEFYRTADSATDGDRLQKVASWLLTSGKSRIVVSDLTSNIAGLRGLTMWDVNQRVSPLVAGGWLMPEGTDPVSRAWTVNPEIHRRLDARRAEEEARKAALADLMRAPRKERADCDG